MAAVEKMVEVVVCRDVVPVRLSAVGDPVLVWVGGLLTAPGFPVGSGVLDAVCSFLVTVTVVLSVLSTRNNTTTVNRCSHL